MVVRDRGKEMRAVARHPSCIARANAASDHVPMPVSVSGVMLVE